jgi:CBS domain-containing membrane protein
VSLRDDPNLELDVDRIGGQTRLRIRVGYARGYSSQGAAPIITDDCLDEAQLASEVERLKQELDQALATAGSEGPPQPSPAAEEPAAAVASDLAKPHLDSALEVADLMTREVRTLDRNDKLVVADELMRLGRFRHAVVLDDDGRLAGVLSQRDIFFNALAWSLGQGEAAHRKALEACRVKEVMRHEVVTIASDAPIAEAARLLSEHKIGCLPVLDGEALVGILTEGDFLALLATRQESA